MNDDYSEAGNSMLMVRHKVVFVGDVCVGKTSIMNRFTENSFKDNYDPTIGVDFFSKQIEFRNSSIKIQIWDSAGQERYKALIPSYIRGAAIIFVVYDMSRKETFENIPSWVSFIKTVKAMNAVLALCGNKSDLPAMVSTDEGRKFAETEGLLFFEVSAKTGKNVRLMFFSSLAELPYFKQFGVNDKYSLIDELENQNDKTKQDSTIFDIVNARSALNVQLTQRSISKGGCC